MRDGMHKFLPLPRRWQSFFKTCEREAEREKYALEAGTRAIETDFREGIGEGFLRRAERAIEKSLRQLPGMRQIPSLDSLGGENTPLQSIFQKKLGVTTQRSEILDARILVHDVLVATINEHRGALVRELTRHAYENGVDRKAKAIDAAIREILAATNANEIATRLLNSSPAHTEPLRPPVELDEALS